MKRKFFATLIIFIICKAHVFGATLPNISADGAILIEPKTNTILYAKNMNETFYPASTTKVLTCLALANDLDMNLVSTKTQASVNTVPSDSSHIGLQVGDTYNVYNGLHGILMSSDNFISHDLAILDKGSITNFATHMNELAVLCGATNSNFVNPHGYHDEDHYTTPYDMSQITRAAFDDPIVSEIAGLETFDFEIIDRGSTIPLKHTSSLLNSNSEFYNPNVVASKTGYHTPAGRTLVAKAVYGDIELIGIIMRTNSPNQFIDMNNLFEYGSKYFEEVTTDDGNTFIRNHTYSNWAEPTINTALQNNWIANTPINYTSTISSNTFVNILKSAVPKNYHSYLNSYSSDSIYKENLPVTRDELAKICYSFLNNLSIYIPPHTKEISDLEIATNKSSIQFCVATGIISTDENGNFMPNETVSYESALAIISKLNGIIERYDSYGLISF